jgi:hypothetical protein
MVAGTCQNVTFIRTLRVLFLCASIYCSFSYSAKGDEKSFVIRAPQMTEACPSWKLDSAMMQQNPILPVEGRMNCRDDVLYKYL